MIFRQNYLKINNQLFVLLFLLQTEQRLNHQIFYQEKNLKLIKVLYQKNTSKQQPQSRFYFKLSSCFTIQQVDEYNLKKLLQQSIKKLEINSEYLNQGIIYNKYPFCFFLIIISQKIKIIYKIGCFRIQKMVFLIVWVLFVPYYIL
ncbi:unnamed protein product [Paramecium sonneborni]|uniref:Transmembrane protein n=1 Tax=Paramecium sonneborni TaxID=65129 RepID=A0A8S1NSE0_9CILI|nr:unnamed protein product [Paramecium sonneborni]